MFHSIRNKFLVPMVILVVLGMGISSFLSYRLSKNALQESKIHQLTQTVQSTTKAIEIWMKNRELDISIWAEQDLYETALGTNFLGKAARKTVNDTFTHMQQEYEYYTGFRLTDDTGTVIASSSPGNIGKLNVKDRSYFTAAMGGNSFVSKVLKSKTSGKPIIVISAPVKNKSGQVGGVFYAVVGLAAFNSNFIDPIKIGESGYAYIVDQDGYFLAHPNKDNILSTSIVDLGFGKDLLSSNDTVFYYTFEGIDKISAIQKYDKMGWRIVINSDIDEVYAAVNKLGTLSIILVVSVVSIASILIFFIANSVAKPIKEVVDGLRDAAEGDGDLTKRLKVGSRDEVGELSSCFNTFVEKVQNIIGDIRVNINTLNTSAESLSSLSENLSSGSDDSSQRSNNVAAAAEEMNANMVSVADTCEQASSNVNMVASATEEMNVTVSEIAGNTGKAREIAEDAVAKTNSASHRMAELGNAAQEINKVTETITEISEQTNLLALNATIEAARAGEAGKGFAVVANEIKELAKQTAEATLEIRQRIDAIQSSTDTTVGEMEQINSVINDVNSIVTTIATAVEEQATSTDEIASNVAQAAQGITEVNENVSQSSAVSGEISSEIAEVSKVASTINDNSSQVNSQANELLTLSAQLDKAVNQFKL